MPSQLPGSCFSLKLLGFVTMKATRKNNSECDCNTFMFACLEFFLHLTAKSDWICAESLAYCMLIICLRLRTIRDVAGFSYSGLIFRETSSSM